MIFLGGLLARIPGLKIIAGVALAFFVGLGFGNYIATQKAVRAAIDATAQRDAAEQSAQAKALIEQRQHDIQIIAEAQKTQREADNAQHAQFEADNAAARAAADRARALVASERTKANEQQAKAQQTIEGLKNVSAMLADMAREPPIVAPLTRVQCGSGELRRLLDEASGARGNGDVAASREAAAGAARGVATETRAGADAANGLEPLNCDQLVRWAPNIVEWGRKGWNWGAAWDTWADKALPAQ